MKIAVLSFLLSTALAGNIVEELTAAGATTLVDLVVKAGLADTLTGPGPFTVVAPDNEAFAKLPAELLATLSGDVELLKKVLLFHVVPGMAVMKKDIANNMVVPFPDADSLHIVNVYLKSKFYDGFVTVNGKLMKKYDITADNGVIHILSDVVYPFPSATIAQLVAADDRFSTLLAAVVAAGLADTLASEGPFTVFAPTNEAFAKIPKDALDGLLADTEALKKVLLRHVLPGALFKKGISWDTHSTAGGEEEDMIATQVFKGDVIKVVSSVGGTRKGARVVAADIIATNGVIHAIDTVI
eukprot:TRINITY_DN7422_c0_g1_i8.p1 TRINITY_DN7422_c0_g1~~TRINITY_DN7422_c0_g1_i8.p1  ORF type:complete len:299 (-),score=114.09 TRINITY_DN7422_c0_g1_i8:101-997(-)